MKSKNKNVHLVGHFHQRPTRWITDLGNGLLSVQHWPLLLLAGHSTVGRSQVNDSMHQPPYLLPKPLCIEAH